MEKGLYIAISKAYLAVVLAGCSNFKSNIPGFNPSTDTPIPALTQTNTPQPTATYTLTPTATNTPTQTATFTPAPPIEGMLFFDMNGSGLQDEATFQYDSAMLSDKKQPLQRDLLVAINAYVQELPDLKTGDLVKITEPWLSGYTVCAGKSCDATDAEGRFSITYSGTNISPYLKITDPNIGTPALEMRYINQWNGSVVIPAYEMNGVQVLEQHLNDTKVLSIKMGITSKPGSKNEIGLMQGFLTLPYGHDLDFSPIIVTFTDLDLRIGNRLDWKGNFKSAHWGDKTIWNDVVAGVSDQHQGTDFAMPEGTPIIAMADGYIQNSEGGYPQNYARYVRHSITLNGAAEIYLVTYAHNSTNLVSISTSYVRRGQLLALSGTDAGLSITEPHLHVSIWDIPHDIWNAPPNSSIMYDFLFGRGDFKGNGREVIYPGGYIAALDFCPYEHLLYTVGSVSTYSK